MKKIVVIGSGGAGKSTFSRRLGLRLGIEVIHLDRLYWKPGWTETPAAEWEDLVRGVIASRDAWIVDGNYSGTLGTRIQASDTIIFLDLPRMLCLWRVVKRAFKYHGITRPDIADGCTERIDLAFLKWVWRYPQRSRPKVLALLDAHRQQRTIIRLRSPVEVEQFLARTAPPCACS